MGIGITNTCKTISGSERAKKSHEETAGIFTNALFALISRLIPNDERSRIKGRSLLVSPGVSWRLGAESAREAPEVLR